MVQRAFQLQICGVCGAESRSKAEMEEHTSRFHGKNWPPAQLTRAEDQMEFKPHLMKTRWGSDLR
jgi:hypothetical protein